MADFIFSAFCDESGEDTVEGQIKACKANGITHMELRGLRRILKLVSQLRNFMLVDQWDLRHLLQLNLSFMGMDR